MHSPKHLYCSFNFMIPVCNVVLSTEIHAFSLHESIRERVSVFYITYIFFLICIRYDYMYVCMYACTYTCIYTYIYSYNKDNRSTRWLWLSWEGVKRDGDRNIELGV